MPNENAADSSSPEDMAREHCLQALGRLAEFWGFPRSLGAAFGALYLSPAPLGLDQLCAKVRVSKGSMSATVRTMERLGLAHRRLKAGDRKDYYEAESDFWNIVRGVLRERERRELGTAVASLGAGLRLLPAPPPEGDDGFVRSRLTRLQSALAGVDMLVEAVTALDRDKALQVRDVLARQRPRQR